MVKTCNNNSYPKENNAKYAEHFAKFGFPLSDFQKHAIEAIVDGHHSLVCCPTGSGKTLPAEFAIDYFTQPKQNCLGKRVIYTSPLKALSNEKFYDFTKKYPHISIGLLTGDIKINTDAQVLIMTAEILLNTLFVHKNQNQNQNQNTTKEKTTKEEQLKKHIPLSFEMDFENELGCIIMDEIHYINDESRGKVWEQTLMIIPPHIQLIMLSATLDNPEKFAEWIENRHEATSEPSDRKQVYLSHTSHRIVPLTHYSFIVASQSLFKQIAKNEELCKEVKDLICKPLVIQSSKGVFNEPQYHKNKKVLDLLQAKNVYIKRQHVINEVCRYMVLNDMLPAVIFILSRKQIEIVATEITVILLEDDSKIPYIVQKECDEIIRKLPNYEEYKFLPEYVRMVALLEKGIGIHHSGILPVLREMVEILFSKGYIKLLLATETFSVGLNMPIKTTVFTSLSKFDGNQHRLFYSHEYMQCSGRAGRRGIDTVGNVIHLNNLFKPLSITDYRLIMNGKPQTLVSKFKISYNLILHLIYAEKYNFLEVLKHSLLNTVIDNDISVIHGKIREKKRELENTIDCIGLLKTPKSTVERYIYLEETRSSAINKKRKEIEREMSDIVEQYKTIEKDKTIVAKYQLVEREIAALKRELDNTENFLNNTINKIVGFLLNQKFIETLSKERQTAQQTAQVPTISGLIATQIKETHCLAFADIFFELQALDTKELIQVFSCFTNVVVADEFKTNIYKQCTSKVVNIIDIINAKYNQYMDFENENHIETGMDYMIHYNLIQYMNDWYDAADVDACKLVLQRVAAEKGIFLGEFVKAVLKINNISLEFESIAENLGCHRFQQVLKQIPVNTLKFVITTQSLYI